MDYDTFKEMARGRQGIRLRGVPDHVLTVYIDDSLDQDDDLDRRIRDAVVKEFAERGWNIISVSRWTYGVGPNAEPRELVPVSYEVLRRAAQGADPRILALALTHVPAPLLIQWLLHSGIEDGILYEILLAENIRRGSSLPEGEDDGDDDDDESSIESIPTLRSILRTPSTARRRIPTYRTPMPVRPGEIVDCPICMEGAVRNLVRLPCGHVLCRDCCERLPHPEAPCPLCRAPFENVLRFRRAAFGVRSRKRIVMGKRRR